MVHKIRYFAMRAIEDHDYGRLFCNALLFHNDHRIDLLQNKYLEHGVLGIFYKAFFLLVVLGWFGISQLLQP